MGDNLTDRDTIDNHRVDVRLGATMMAAECLLILILTLMGMRLLRRRQRVSQRAAMEKASTRRDHGVLVSDFHYHLMWMLFVSDFSLALTSLPAFVGWSSAGKVSDYSLCLWQASTSVFSVSLSVLSLSLVSFERQYQLVYLRPLPFRVHVALMLVALGWSIALGAAGTGLFVHHARANDLDPFALWPISANGYFCAPPWSTPFLFSYTLACAGTLLFCVLVIFVSTIRIMGSIPPRHLRHVACQLFAVCSCFVVHWGGYFSLMMYETFRPSRVDTLHDLAVADAIITFLGFNNATVNAAAFLYWYSTKGPANAWKEAVRRPVALGVRPLPVVAIDPRLDTEHTNGVGATSGLLSPVAKEGELNGAVPITRPTQSKRSGFFFSPRPPLPPLVPGTQPITAAPVAGERMATTTAAPTIVHTLPLAPRTVVQVTVTVALPTYEAKRNPVVRPVLARLPLPPPADERDFSSVAQSKNFRIVEPVSVLSVRPSHAQSTSASWWVSGAGAEHFSRYKSDFAQSYGNPATAAEANEPFEQELGSRNGAITDKRTPSARDPTVPPKLSPNGRPDTTSQKCPPAGPPAPLPEFLRTPVDWQTSDIKPGDGLMTMTTKTATMMSPVCQRLDAPVEFVEVARPPLLDIPNQAISRTLTISPMSTTSDCHLPFTTSTTRSPIVSPMADTNGAAAASATAAFSPASTVTKVAPTLLYTVTSGSTSSLSIVDHQ